MSFSLQNKIVTEAQWIDARKELLAKEKELSKQRDELTKLRQALPWRKIDKEYVFNSNTGVRSLADLFGDHSQLIVYHFMFDPTWDEGCKSCSLLADHYDPLVVHLKARDVTLVTVSIAPIEKLTAYRKRMGWSFDWVSSSDCDFNRDFKVTFTDEEKQSGSMDYNYQQGSFPVTECPGVSSFYKNDSGDIFHTYSSYSRGLENLLGVYSFLDLVPKGRNEQDLPYGMYWVRHKDRYDDDSFDDPYVELMID